MTMIFWGSVLNALIMFCNILPFSAVAAVICFFIRKKYFSKKNITRNQKRELAVSVFVFYLTALFIFVLTPKFLLPDILHRLMFGLPEGTAAHIPLFNRSEWTYRLNLFFAEYELYDVILNFIMFLPCGFLCSLIFSKLKGRSMIICAGISLFIELAQLPLGRFSDIRDILMNTLGAATGYFIYLRFRRSHPDAVKSICSADCFGGKEGEQ